ncbi:hypothetical protein AYY26_06495 [Photobacterium phosphoreum]|nr:hypothetical protein AYY24_07745 [Photobacterium phosphoreum]OBU33959.1 hypothetical protein AYY25_06790 [Photobacterium phosphoreum]OBU41264.1 hypothetical protein AYY26_06495 [Photobacterium phosphoreum]
MHGKFYVSPIVHGVALAILLSDDASYTHAVYDVLNVLGAYLCVNNDDEYENDALSYERSFLLSKLRHTMIKMPIK